MLKMELANWGNYPRIVTELHEPDGIHALVEYAGQANDVIARGLGRCYGDSASNPNLVLSTLRCGNFISFDETSGILEAEAGVSLAEILEIFAPRGWFAPVTPGTKFITIGGAIASDVHGKNHHIAGTFGNHVRWLDLYTAEKGIVRCSPSENHDLFYSTCGGHGMTGIILRASINLERIPSVWIRQKTIKTRDLQGIMEAFEENAQAPFSVAWIDCLQKGRQMGRSIMMLGRFAEKDELPVGMRSAPWQMRKRKMPGVPFNFPSLTLNPLSVRVFNALYYSRAPKGTANSLTTYDKFFYPLDAIDNWNRIYGKAGFIQYQFVIPKEAAARGLPDILKRIAESGAGSFLAVLKLFGRQKEFPGNISFPAEGYTLALDFPMTGRLLPLLDRLDEMIMEYGGRHYLTKDARMNGETFRKGYGKKLDEFLEVKSLWDPRWKFGSCQARRLGLETGTR